MFPFIQLTSMKPIIGTVLWQALYMILKNCKTWLCPKRNWQSDQKRKLIYVRNIK